jgi:CRISPR-associated endonuclease Cas1
VPQGAILSPLLANLYLNSFDKFIVSKSSSYVRYADDFVIFCDTEEKAKSILEEATSYLSENLKLSLNEPVISKIEDGFDFLGLTIGKHTVGLSEKKFQDLKEKINLYNMTPFGLNSIAKKSWKGFANYYIYLLPQDILTRIDGMFFNRIKDIISFDPCLFKNRDLLKKTLEGIGYLSEEFEINKDKYINELLEVYSVSKKEKKDEPTASPEEKNKKLIKQKKKEYQKKESEGSELYISKPGVFVGLTVKGITVKEKGVIIHQKPLGSLSHIIIAGKGVSISSNMLEYCLKNKVSVDFFDGNTHIGSFLSAKQTENNMWRKQAFAGTEKHNKLAMAFISGKVKYQFNLIKYFHKYHKSKYPDLDSKFEDMERLVDKFDEYRRREEYGTEDFVTKLVGFESVIAISYWAYIRQLLQDDDVGFEQRVRKGATDRVNAMLNYGYAILYTRAWQSLLSAKLNPYESIVHVRQAGKPTFVYDFVEMFRAQVVDRVVITLIQRGVSVECENGMLDEETRKTLAKSVLERLGRYEKYKGEELKLEQIISAQAREVAEYYDKESVFKPYVAKW